MRTRSYDETPLFLSKNYGDDSIKQQQIPLSPLQLTQIPPTQIAIANENEKKNGNDIINKNDQSAIIQSKSNEVIQRKISDSTDNVSDIDPNSLGLQHKSDFMHGDVDKRCIWKDSDNGHNNENVKDIMNKEDDDGLVCTLRKDIDNNGGIRDDMSMTSSLNGKRMRKEFEPSLNKRPKKKRKKKRNKDNVDIYDQEYVDKVDNDVAMNESDKKKIDDDENGLNEKEIKKIPIKQPLNKRKKKKGKKSETIDDEMDPYDTTQTPSNPSNDNKKSKSRTVTNGGNNKKKKKKKSKQHDSDDNASLDSY